MNTVKEFLQSYDAQINMIGFHFRITEGYENVYLDIFRPGKLSIQGEVQVDIGPKGVTVNWGSSNTRNTAADALAMAEMFALAAKIASKWEALQNQEVS